MNPHISKFLRRLCAVIVVLFLSVSEVALAAPSSSVVAQSATTSKEKTNDKQPSEAVVSAENESLRGEFEKHYLLSDGSFMAVTYAEAVHYKDGNGKWQEVDNTLTQKNGKGNRIENAYEAFKVSFANTGSTGDMVSLSGKGSSLSWSLHASKKNGTRSAIKSDNSYKVTLPKSEPSKKSSQIVGKKATDKDSFASEKMAGKLRFESVESDSPELSVDYTVYHNKIEEDIYINAPTEAETIDFAFHTNGLRAVVNKDQSVEFLTDKGIVKYRIGIPYMEDAKGNVLNKIEVSVSQDDTACIISYRPDPDWFHSSDRAYPILLDPSITTGEYQSNITDTYVVQGNTENHSSEQKLYIGVRSGKIYRTYLKVNNLPNIDSNMPIVSATLQLKNTIGSSTGKMVQLYRCSNSWNPSTITYANQPSISSGNYTAFCGFQDTYSFDLTYNITNLYAGSFANNGYVLKYSDESSNKPDYNAVYSSEYTTVAYRPVLTIVYGYALPTVLTNGGVYSFQNVGSNSFLTVHGGSDANGTNVYQQKVSTSSRAARHKFKLEYVAATGGYYLRAMCSSNGGNRVLDIAKQNGYVVNGCNVQIYNPTDALAQHWFIIGVGRNEFKIVPRTNMSLALKAYSSSSDGTAGGKTSTSAGNVFVATYTSSDRYQRWCIVDEGGSSSGGEDYIINTGNFYLNNKAYGKFIDNNGGNLSTVSGLTAALGNRIRWKITFLGDGKYTIQSVSEPAKYLYASGSTIKLGSMTSGSNVPSNYTWVITKAAGGDMLIKNLNTGKYLRFNGSSLTSDTSMGAAGSTDYNKYVWRVAATSSYGVLVSSGSKHELTGSSNLAPLVIDVNETKSASLNKNPSDAWWSDLSDFTFSIDSRIGETPEDFVAIAPSTGQITGKKPGIGYIKAVHKVTNQVFTFKVTVDYYTYILTSFFHFDEPSAILIRKVYDAIDNKFPSDSRMTRAWKASRLLSSFDYTGFKWANVASEVVECTDSELKNYFKNTLGFTESAYEAIKSSIKNQHSSCASNRWPDFAHQQASLAARLAYKLDLDGFLSNAYTFQGDLTVSYLAGWLGDATIVSNNQTHFDSDDYYADLDAENLYWYYVDGKDVVDAIITYYKWLGNGGNRATKFLTHCSYNSVILPSVNTELLKYLDVYSATPLIEQIRVKFPDTYSFLRSLQDGLNQMGTYE